jgi:signal transduction histidine kinase
VFHDSGAGPPSGSAASLRDNGGRPQGLVLREAVTNVLDNAIKYSPVGSTVRIKVARLGDQALLAIADEGPGIPSEYREHIFHRFFRVDQARSRDGGGAGLGLAIAKWAVEMHGGQITVDQPRGGGSEFVIRLPLAPTVAAAEEQKTTHVHVGG